MVLLACFACGGAGWEAGLPRDHRCDLSCVAVSGHWDSLGGDCLSQIKHPRDQVRHLDLLTSESHSPVV